MPEKLVRVRPAHMGGPCAVRHPEHGEFVVPNPAQPYSANDPLVLEYPWLFVSDEALAEQAAHVPPTSVAIETATARPGSRGKARKPK